jgi:hypothetical protein
VPPGEESRRSVYIQVRRSKPLAVLAAFDLATAEPNCEARNSSTATPQALILMNGDFAVTQAAAFAERVRKEAGAESRDQVTRAWKLVYLREPTEKELARGQEFLWASREAFSKQPAPAVVPPKKGEKVPEPPSAEMRALAAFCQVLLSSNRFLYVD